MARFRRKARARFAGFARKGFRRAKRYARSHREPLGVLGGAMLYGAIREPIANAITPVTQYLQPYLGEAADEVTLAAGAYFGHRYISKIPMVGKHLANGILVVEGARIGEILKRKFIGGSTTSNMPMYG